MDRKGPKGLKEIEMRSLKSFNLTHSTRRIIGIDRRLLICLLAIAVFSTIFMPSPSAMIASARTYGVKETISTAVKNTGRAVMNRVTGGASRAAFGPTLVLAKSLTPATPTAFQTGQEFTYELRWTCAGSVSPADDCVNMKIEDTLPAYIQFVSSAPIAAPLASVSTATIPGSPDLQKVTYNFQPLVTAR